MEKLIFDFKDPRLDAGLAARCVLNVVIGMESVSLLVTEKSGEVRALQTRHLAHTGRDFDDAETAIRTVFGGEPLFSLPFATVNCAFFNLNATLVPRRLLLTEDLGAYFQLLLRPANYTYHHDPLPEFDCHLVYAVEPWVARLCEQYFPAANMIHLSTAMLKCWQHQASPGGYEVMLNVRNHAAQIAVFDRQNLLLYNAFQFQKSSDLLYFTLLAYDQFRLSPEEIALTVSGNLAEHTEDYKTLFRYVHTIRLGHLPLSAVLPVEADGWPEHFWLDLFSIPSSVILTT